MEHGDDLLKQVGLISGQLEGIRSEQSRHSALLDRIDSRMGKVESSIKLHSVVGGGLVAGMVSLGMEYIKMAMGRT